MAIIVMGDICNLMCAPNKTNFFGIDCAVEFLYNIYIVWLYWKRKRKKDKEREDDKKLFQ